MMTDAPADTPHDAPAPPPGLAQRLRWLAPIGIAFALSLAFAWTCRQVAGDTLGLFFGGIGIATILVPPLALAGGRWAARAMMLAAVVAGVALVWLAPVLNSVITAPEWLRAVAILVSYAVALFGVCTLLARLRIAPALASALTMIVFFAWLSWPVWMAPCLTGANRESTVAALVAPHPLFTLNGALSRAMPVPWVQHILAYRLTNIGDDIVYEMPKGINRCTLLHALVGTTLIALAWIRFKAPPAHPPADQSARWPPPPE